MRNPRIEKNIENIVFFDEIVFIALNGLFALAGSHCESGSFSQYIQYSSPVVMLHQLSL